MITEQKMVQNDPSIGDMVQRVRSAQHAWSKTELRDRLKIVRTIRGEIARSASSFLEAFPPALRVHPAERLASELIPLAEACRFLEKEADSVLAPRRLKRKSSPFWLRSITVKEHRDPLGVVLIIGPANYPLFLPGVQAVQALTAGNAVLVKPGAGGGPVLEVFRDIVLRAGMHPDLLLILDDTPTAAQKVIAEEVEKVVLTGSLLTGEAVYRAAARTLTPVTLELSGDDPVFVQDGADLERAVDAISFGIRWNGGNTCLAPNRIFVAESVADTFEALLQMKCPEAGYSLPITRFTNEEEALMQAADSPFALGASVFGQPAAAQDFARKVRGGVVVVNDIIMPTADPRVAFGGRGHSGFGTTRGAEGLRQFTALKVVIAQRARRLRHLEPLPDRAENLFREYLLLSHAQRWRDRLKAVVNLFRGLRTMRSA
jgi:acyl-CoA reductase-like NAD-dependent aldehyde dehydrogenase